MGMTVTVSEPKDITLLQQNFAKCLAQILSELKPEEVEEMKKKLSEVN